MSSAEQQLSAAIQDAKQSGYMQNGSRWITPSGRTLPEGADPLPVQKAAIQIGFRAAADDPEFDIFSVVAESAVNESRTTAENMRQVFKRWEKQTDKSVNEARKQLEQAGYDLTDGE